MKKRWNGHVTKSKNSRDGRWHFANAIRKYGPDAFTYEVLKEHFVRKRNTVNQ